MGLIPTDATRMELLVVHDTLRRIKTRILEGVPAGLVIDQAIEETWTLATEFSDCGQQPASG